MSTKLFEKGLLPAIVQDFSNGMVLMLGYMNAEAYARTQETGEVWFFSRSRQTLWRKGESSGNVLKVKELYLDCDEDTLLIKADPLGPTCHTGEVSCFHKGIDGGEKKLKPDIFHELLGVIQDRKAKPTEGYTSQLFQQGIERIAKKFGEEAVEVVIAALGNDRDEMTWEMADLIYHLLVLMVELDIPWDEVKTVLEKRRGK